MRRIFLAVVASSLVPAALPALAEAHHARHHHGFSHASSHRRHGKRAHLLRFGSGASTVVASTPPTTPVMPPESAGMVETFTGGVLTIKLKDGSFVSGKVTEATRLVCRPATSSSGGSEGDDQGDEGNRQGEDENQGDGEDRNGPAGGDQGNGSGNQDHARAADFQGNDQAGSGQDDNDEDDQESCTTAALVHEAVVLEAELNLSSAGAVWERIVLLS
jgi:hypothetical protein